MILSPATLFVALAVAAAPPANDDSAGAKLIDAVAACRSITVDAERLACFDRTAAAVADARRDKNLVVLDRAEVRKAKRSLFGFSLPSIKLFGGGDDDEALKSLTGTMKRSNDLVGGLSQFTLDDGSVWQTTEQVMRPLRPGDVVTIKAGPLGSYIATAPGRRAVRVIRNR